MYPAMNDWVYPGDIQADCKIVFLNSCKSYPPNGFDTAFDIDGKHKVGNDDLTRDEAYIGWKDRSWIPQGTNFAMEFWMLMGSGMSVDEAINYIKALDEQIYNKIGLRPFNTDQIEAKTPTGCSSPTLVP
jgi:hypothetical protein